MDDYFGDITVIYDLGTEFAEAKEAVKGLGWDEELQCYSDRVWRIEAVPGTGGRYYINVLCEPTRLVAVRGGGADLKAFAAAVDGLVG